MIRWMVNSWNWLELDGLEDDPQWGPFANPDG